MTFDQLKDHINQLIQYNWNDEKEDYRASPDESHLFLTLVDLDNFLNGTETTAEEHIYGKRIGF